MEASPAVVGDLASPRRRQPLVAWVRSRKYAEDQTTLVHLEKAPGATLCGHAVPDDEPDVDVIRGAEALDDADPFWPSCLHCCGLLTALQRRAS